MYLEENAAISFTLIIRGNNQLQIEILNFIILGGVRKITFYTKKLF